jgi:hypothetical protein
MSSLGEFDVSKFLGGKTQLARSLARGECGGRYEDAILIISSIISAFAARIWPRPEREWRCSEEDHKERLGRRFPDNKRFIEFWATYADPAQGSMRIAVPLWAEYLHEFDHTEKLDALRRMRPSDLCHFPEELDGFVSTATLLMPRKPRYWRLVLSSRLVRYAGGVIQQFSIEKYVVALFMS